MYRNIQTGDVGNKFLTVIPAVTGQMLKPPGRLDIVRVLQFLVAVFYIAGKFFH